MNDKNKIPYCPPLRFPEFKDEWKKTTLGEVADFCGGGTPSSKNESFWCGTIPWISSSDIVNSNISNISITRFITQEAIEKSSAKLCKAPCILIVSRVGVGKLAYSEVDLCTSQDFCNLYNIKVDYKLLSYLLLPSLEKKTLEVQGTSIKGITVQEIKSLPIFLPREQKEQQKIANFLSLIDERIQCVSETIKELKRQKVELVNILIYNLNNKDKPLCLFGEMKNGYPFKSEEYETFGTHRIVTISNVTGDRYLNMDNHKAISNLPSDIQDYQMLSTNDILISLTGNVGRVSLCSKGGDLLNQRVGVFKLYDEFYREYVFQAISDNRFEKTMTALGQGAAQLNIYKKDVEEFIIPVPDNKADVIRISNFLSLIDERIEVEEKLLGQYEKQKKYLLSKMFV